MLKKVFIVSLGCPKNLTDAEVMAGRLAAAGFEFTSDETEADIALINTCAFLGSAVKESEDEIKRLLSLKERGRIKKVAVTGCLAEREKDRLLRKFPGIDAVVGINALDLINSALNGARSCIIPAALPLAAPELKVRLTSPHTAYLKIADGCDNHCSYCAIPMIRGHFRSKPVADVLTEAADLSASGAAEISLIAQDTTSYGMDIYGRPRLYDLLKKLAAAPGIRWLRLLYVYPEKLSSEILKLMRDEKTVCRYLDMPLQHISDNVLKKMNRRSTELSIRSKLAAIKKFMPDAAVRTNFIVGFPGETEKDFKKLLKFVKDTGFAGVGVFKYSREPGTSAAGLPDQVPEKIKTARMNELIDAQSRIIDRLNTSLTGKTVEVLMDSANFGRTYRDAPEIDGKVEVTAPKLTAASRRKPAELKAGDFVKVRITGASGYLRRGTLI